MQKIALRIISRNSLESTIIVFIDKFKNIISVVIEPKKVLVFPCKFRKSTITVSNNL